MVNEGANRDDGAPPERVVDDLATLRVVADPLRFRLLQLLERPRTVRELAAAVDRPADRLYYHLRLLHRHRLVEVADERIVNGIVERRFQVTADEIRIAPGLAVPAATRGRLLHAVLEQVGADYEQAMKDAAGDGRVRLAVHHVRLTDEQRRWLDGRLAEVLEELGDGDGDGERFAVVTGYYPVAPPHGGDGDGA